VAVLERDGFKCRYCGKNRDRLEIDHIEPVRLRPDLAYDPANCQALCPSCHSAKTHVEVGRKPPAYDRQGWRKAVADLTAAPETDRATKD